VSLLAKRKCDDDEDDALENKSHRYFKWIASHSSQFLQTSQESCSLQQSVSRQCNTHSGAVEYYEYSSVDVCLVFSES
jgi:hypothetical protein